MLEWDGRPGHERKQVLKTHLERRIGYWSEAHTTLFSNLDSDENNLERRFRRMLL